MRELVLPDTPLSRVPDMQAALAAVFGRGVLEQVHGPGTQVEDFDAAGRRSVRFAVQMDAVPRPLRRLACGGRAMRVTAAQTLEKPGAEDRWTVTSDIELHCVGANLFSVRPRFELRRRPGGGIFISGRVSHRAFLPPPINWLAEKFMCKHSEKEMRHFRSVLRSNGTIAAS